MIRMQMSQNDGIRRQTPGTQKTAECIIIFARIKDINPVMIPQNSRVSVSGAELNVLG